MPTMTQPLITGLPPQPAQSNQSLLGDFNQSIPPKPAVPDLISGVKPPIPQPLIGNGQPLINSPPQMANQPLIQPSQPLIQSSQPLIQPNQPLMQPNQPLMQPNQPLIQPSQPLIQPNLPLIQPTQPLMNTQPLNSSQPLMTQSLTSPPNQMNSINQNQPLVGPSPLVPSSQPQIPTGTTVGSLVSPPKSVTSVAGSIPSQPITSTPITAVKSDSFSKPGKLC